VTSKRLRISVLRLAFELDNIARMETLQPLPPFDIVRRRFRFGRANWDARRERAADTSAAQWELLERTLRIAQDRYDVDWYARDGIPLGPNEWT